MLEFIQCHVIIAGLGYLAGKELAILLFIHCVISSLIVLSCLLYSVSVEILNLIVVS